MYITQWDIHFLSCPLPFKEDCNADGEGIWQFPARLQWSNSHTDYSLSSVRAAESWWEAWYSVEGFRWLKIREGRRGVALFFWTEVEMPTREERKKKTGYDKWRWLRLASEIHHSFVLHTFSLTTGQNYLTTGQKRRNHFPAAYTMICRT